MPPQFARQDERRLRRIGQRHGPGRRFGRQTFHHLHVIKARVAQQWVRGFPIHDRRRFHACHTLEPIGVDDMDGQHVALWPFRRSHAVEHDEIQTRRRVSQIGGGCQLDIGDRAQGLFQKPIPSRDQQNSDRLGQQAGN